MAAVGDTKDKGSSITDTFDKASYWNRDDNDDIIKEQLTDEEIKELLISLLDVLGSEYRLRFSYSEDLNSLIFYNIVVDKENFKVINRNRYTEIVYNQQQTKELINSNKNYREISIIRRAGEDSIALARKMRVIYADYNNIKDYENRSKQIVDGYQIINVSDVIISKVPVTDSIYDVKAFGRKDGIEERWLIAGPEGYPMITTGQGGKPLLYKYWVSDKEVTKEEYYRLITEELAQLDILLPDLANLSLKYI